MSYLGRRWFLANMGARRRAITLSRSSPIRVRAKAMSSDDDAPEEVALATGKETFELEKEVEELHQDQVKRIVEERKAVKKKRRQEVAEEQRKQHAAKKRRSKESALEVDEGAAEELDLLPDDVVAAVLSRVGDQEKEDQKPELEHGRVVEIGKSRKVTEFKKGPVSVKVLGMDDARQPSERATAFRDKLLSRHRRSAAMLRK